MNELTETEFKLLDELYFITSYHTLLLNSGESEEEARSGLKSLLQKGLVDQCVRDQKDFQKLEQPDYDSINDSYFVASKKGLLIHNSRS